MRHLPSNSRVIGLSYSSDKSVDIEEFDSPASDDLNLVFVVTASSLKSQFYCLDYELRWNKSGTSSELLVYVSW
ncbi:hypothetical protein V2J09_016573 [Rumex salicifolius]